MTEAELAEALDAIGPNGWEYQRGPDSRDDSTASPSDPAYGAGFLPTYMAVRRSTPSDTQASYSPSGLLIAVEEAEARITANESA